MNLKKLTKLLKKNTHYGKASVYAKDFIDSLDEQEITEADLVKNEYTETVIRKQYNFLPLSICINILRHHPKAIVDIEYSTCYNYELKKTTTTFNIEGVNDFSGKYAREYEKELQKFHSVKATGGLK